MTSDDAPSRSRVDALPPGVTRTWLGPQYWANRLSDWRLSHGRIECVAAGTGGRTVGVITRSMVAGEVSGSVSVRTGLLSPGAGFSGFLLGAGVGELDWRAAALVMGASGRGGGLLAVYDASGEVQFREHTSEDDPFGYAVLPSTDKSGPAPQRSLREDVELVVDVRSVGDNRFDLTLTARAARTGALLSAARRGGVAGQSLVGGLSLISSTRRGGTTARHWMRELRTGGAKLGVHDRSAGPVLGTLYSVRRSVLKLTAQFMPIGDSEPRQAVLQARLPGALSWRTVGRSIIGSGYAAHFRITEWDASQDWEFRVAHGVGSAQPSYFAGTIRRDPQDQDVLTLAMVNCTIHTYRNLDKASSGRSRLPGAKFLGLHTRDNVYFPYAELVGNIRRQQPDLLVALGDQYYQNKPTELDRANPLLDVLGRYYLWLWSFGDITRTTPTVCLVDDHDVYQGNLWGWSGRKARDGDVDYGGYLMPPAWVNTVQRLQCGHNPDPYDPRPVQQGISVYYAAFSYGGVSFAVLEDRKFKDSNRYGTDRDGNPLPGTRELLGPRQEELLRAWAAMHPGQPKICLTQTVFGCVQTGPTREPLRDPDSNGVPVSGRRTAVRLLRDAHALVLSGDQHLSTLVRHGLDTFSDGPVQFTAPAAGSAWQRWFQPARTLPNSTGPNTGDFTDGFGNKLRVLAAANPKVTAAQVDHVQAVPSVGDRALKREGYGIVRVDKANEHFVIESWPWEQDPLAEGASQYPGWPYTLPFASA